MREYMNTGEIARPGACESPTPDAGTDAWGIEGGRARERRSPGHAMEIGLGGTGTTANGKPRASRAAQFMPFAALTGYYELARQQERITEPRHELTDEEALALSRTIMQVKKGDLIRVTYYDWDAYRTVSGVVARVDFAYRRLQVVKTIIGFDDILDIKR